MRHFLVSDLTVLEANGRCPQGEPAPIASNTLTAEAASNSRLIRRIIIFGIVLVGAIIAATGIALLNFRDQKLADHKEELSRLTSVFAERLDRSFQSIELTQIAIIERMKNLGIASAGDYQRQMSDQGTHQRLQNLSIASPYIDDLLLTDPQGKLINFSSSWPIPNAMIPHSDLSEVFKSDPHLTFYLGKHVRSPVTGAWTFVIARKFTSPNGEFLGVVIGVISLQHFEQLFEAIAPTPNSSIALMLRDGTLPVRYPRQDNSIGQSFSNSDLFANVLSKSDHGTGLQISAIDGKERLIAARTLARYPIVLGITTPVADVLVYWQSGVMIIAGTGLLMVLMVGGLVFLSATQIARKLGRYNLQLDTALNNMGQGLIMFDSAARLVVCNDRYRQMFKLSPDLVKTGCTFLDILKYRAANRTFFGNPEQYVGDVIAAIAQGATVKNELETADGRTILVSNQPIADGGWVATHEDISEAKRKETSFRLLFKSNPVPLWVIDRESLRFLAVNDAAIAHYGYSHEQFMSMTAIDLRPAEDQERSARYLKNLTAEQIVGKAVQHVKADGIKIDVCIYSRILTYEGHSARLGAIHDITALKLTEDNLRRTRKFLDAVVENVPLPIVVKSVPDTIEQTSEYRFTLINRAAEELFKVSRDQMIGKNAHEVYAKDHADFVVDQDIEALQAKGAIQIPEHAVGRPGHDIRFVTSRKVAIRDDNGKPKHLLSLLEDVTERSRSEQRILRMAHYDSLTDLPNRVTFNETMDATLDRVRTSGEQLAVMSVDLDNFKEVNDIYGHTIGDELLQETARRLQTVAGGAFVARLGGDEFMLIVTEGAQPAATAALAERLFAAFADDFEFERYRLKLGLSIGAAVYPTDGTDVQTLMVNADAALYQAKTEARGTIRFFEADMAARLRERRDLQNDLRFAVGRGELLLHYQPQHKISGETIGFEALVRWQCPNRGLVAPGTFIPIAEQSSLILPIGEWILREACREAASWPQRLTIAVNISPVQFHHGDLPRLVHSILLETGLKPAHLELEITEGVLISDFSRAVSILNKLKSLGVKIAMDDFGSGYSSLSYLHSFPFDKIKIDRLFVSDLEYNRHSMAIVRAIISLGHSLDIPLIAEGVETEAQRAFLIQAGCDEVQGYLTGRPHLIEDYAELVGRQTSPKKNYATAG